MEIPVLRIFARRMAAVHIQRFFSIQNVRKDSAFLPLVMQSETRMSVAVVVASAMQMIWYATVITVNRAADPMNTAVSRLFR